MFHIAKPQINAKYSILFKSEQFSYTERNYLSRKLNYYGIFVFGDW